jgi:hypothetical protein
LQPTDIQLYAESQRVVTGVWSLAERVCDLLQEQNWQAVISSPDKDDPLTAFTAGLRPPGEKPWWTKPGSRRGKLGFQISPYDQRVNPPGPTPTVWVGVELDQSAQFKAE